LATRGWKEEIDLHSEEYSVAEIAYPLSAQKAEQKAGVMDEDEV
jgi:hypothetical protein